MQGMFSRLSEKDKLLYTGVEALKFSYGGISYIAQLFACSRNTILRGIIELIFKQDLEALVDALGIAIRGTIIQHTRPNGILLRTEYSHTLPGHYKVWY